MLGIGFQELLLILVIAIVVVGPKKLPELAKSLGKGLQEFKKATEGLKSSLGEHEAIRDLQDIKNTVQETVSSLKPAGFLDLEPKPTPAEPAPPAPEIKKFETPEAAQLPQEDMAEPALQPKAPVENLEGRIAIMDGIASEFHQPEPAPEATTEAAAPEAVTEGARPEPAAPLEPAPQTTAPDEPAASQEASAAPTPAAAAETTAQTAASAPATAAPTPAAPKTDA